MSEDHPILLKPDYAQEVEVTWAVVNEWTKLECVRCGSTEELPMGLLVVQFADILGGFARRHAGCLP